MTRTKFFVVDDDPHYAHLLIRTLHNEGFTHIEYYDSGENCLEHLDHDPDVILLDHYMRGLTGLETLKSIKKMKPETYVIYVSGQEETDIAVTSLKLGAFDYIMKGDDEFNQLSDIVRRIPVAKDRKEKAQEGEPVKHLGIREFLFGRGEHQKSTKPYRSFLNVLIWALIFFSLSACTSQNLFTDKNNQVKSGFALAADTSTMDYKICKGDKVSISIWDHDDLSVGSVYNIYNSNEVYGKWLMVDQQGNIAIPQMGNIKVEGMTVQQLKTKLLGMYGAMVVDPIIDVRILNRQVSVLGEVNKPGSVDLDKEHLTLLQVIAMAGDFDNYADKKKIKLIRQTDEDNSVEYEINLMELDAATQNRLVVCPGDVIYVPSRKGKMLDLKAPSILPIASVVTAAAILYASIGK